MVFSNQNDAVVALQMVGPTAQGAVVILGEDNDDMSKINLPPVLHVRAAQAKEKPHTSYTFTLIKKKEGSKPSSHPFKRGATQAKGSKFWLEANENEHVATVSLSMVRKCWDIQ